MTVKIKEILEEQKGSSLAFVIIIGVIIMIMVASLLAVANSDFTFTQETVESRQAYIDAKSVIEYGKIEINSREKELAAAYQALVAAKNDNKSTAATIDRIKNDIAALESKVTTIYGSETNPAGSLSFSDDGTKTIIGKVFVEKTATAVNTTDTSQYIFKVETENLRRKLDYQVDYSYAMTTGGTGSGTGSGSGSTGAIVPPTKPNFPALLPAPDITNTSEWKSTQISVQQWGSQTTPKITKCIIAGVAQPYLSTIDNASNLAVLNVNASTQNVKIDSFLWANDPILNLISKNTYVETSVPVVNVMEASFNITAVGNGTIESPAGEIRFKEDYVQKNGGNGKNPTNTLKAKNVVFEKNLEIYDSNTLVIECENLWIKGSVIVNYPGGSHSNLNIRAKNMIVEGDVEVGSYSKIATNCSNIWIAGDINTQTAIPELEFIDINYLEAGNINLDYNCQLTVKGADANTSQMNVKSIIPYESNAYQLNFIDLWSFTCEGLGLNTNSTLNLESNIIKINGALTLGPRIINSVIKTQYFDCSGMTTIDDLTGDLSIRRIDYNKPLYVRFGGGYTQTQKNQNQKSVIIGETDKKINKGATLVVLDRAYQKTMLEQLQ